MKSFARDGDNDTGRWAAAAPPVLVSMTQTLRPATDSERNTIDDEPPHTA
ncbi:hypothetical protein GCM10010278_27820 [Streptomyces melanogenes]|nr:hypothetical protein GCM10010278_27820 [Streptomyces melanogenes]